MNTDDDEVARRERLQAMFRRAAEIAEIDPRDRAVIQERFAAGDEQGAHCAAELAVKRAIIAEVEAALAAGLGSG